MSLQALLVQRHGLKGTEGQKSR